MTEPHNAHAAGGAVLLDIGGDVGALVVTMPAALIGREVEVHPGRGASALPPPQDRVSPPHAEVLSRPTPIGPVPSLVFDGLRAGPYVLAERGSTEVGLSAEVTGGRVTYARWPD